MVVTTCSIVFKGLIKILWRTIPNFCSFWPQPDSLIQFWHLWLELSTLQDASHLPRDTIQVTRKTAVGVPLATLASWPCWVAASTPASNFWALPEFFVKIWAGKFEKNIQTASTPASSFWELPEFLTTFHWNHNYGSFKNYIGKIFTLLHHLPSHLTLTFLTLNVHWHFISTYLPLLVNVVLEWPLICKWSCSFTQYY